jgi:hypothetical protein
VQRAIPAGDVSPSRRPHGPGSIPPRRGAGPSYGLGAQGYVPVHSPGGARDYMGGR